MENISLCNFSWSQKIGQARFLKKESGVVKILDFNKFTSSGVNDYVRGGVQDEELYELFAIKQPGIANMQKILEKTAFSFRDSSKVEFNNNEDRGFSEADKYWLNREPWEDKFADVFFNGDWDEYFKHLIKDPNQATNYL